MTDKKICRLLFKEIEEPLHLLCYKVTNVYDNKYRINLYGKKHIDETLEGIRMIGSYFAALSEDGNKLTILS